MQRQTSRSNWQQLAPRWTISSEINQQHDPLVNLLPIEIASLVFRYCLPDIPSFKSLKKLDE
ncbi:hypothetical protein CPB83DRAFT_864050 [Crepidotus variabilis]|uniref:F-box domain-containing protein n=1 Tax=Crepidotus variabilis TaxID=179855 RepID=A0A9P6E568_9AGAR|nr:hypothetical protein CPB83DRAFT_864050 [Crepidotus variabilis]